MHNFSWLVPGEVAGLARPDPGDGERLREEGITALVSLTRRPPFPEAAGGPSILHLPVADMTAPSQEQLLAAVRFIAAAVAAGGAGAVHCTAGWGRTGTVLAAWLVSRGEEPGEAVARVRDARPGSIETAEQERAVHRFEATWKRAVEKEAQR